MLLVAGVLLLVSAHLLDGRYAWARAVAWGESDVGDQFRFPARTIPAGDQVSALPRGPQPGGFPEIANLGGTGVELDSFLEATDTRAFLVVRHDRLVYEKYLNGATHNDRQTSFSSAKSFVSTLIGIATDEGFIGSVEDPITAYLPELAERDKRFSDITIRDLLTMSSGLHYREDGLPWSDDALTYYATNLRKLALEHTQVDQAPGRTWHYDNYNPLLLGLILERATNMSVSEFMSTRLWQPLGAEADASWSLDSTSDGFEKMESGINARPVDFARFGLMMLHNGTWNGHRIVSSRWVREATAVDTITDSADFYQYMWWVTPRAETDRSPFFAMGKYGQLIGVFPEQDTVIVRLGSDYGDTDWQAVLIRMADQVAER